MGELYPVDSKYLVDLITLGEIDKSITDLLIRRIQTLGNIEYISSSSEDSEEESKNLEAVLCNEATLNRIVERIKETHVDIISPATSYQHHFSALANTMNSTTRWLSLASVLNRFDDDPPATCVNKEEFYKEMSKDVKPE